MIKEIGTSLLPVSGESLRKDVGLNMTLGNSREDVQNWGMVWAEVRDGDVKEPALEQMGSSRRKKGDWK